MKHLIILLSTAALASCAHFEGHVDQDVSLSLIVDRVECELQEAYLQYRPTYSWLDTWGSSFLITLQRDDTSGITPTLGYSSGHFKGDVALEVSGRTTRTLTTKRTVKLADLKHFSCPSRVSDGSLFTGRLGIVESLGDALAAYDGKDVIGKTPDDLGYKIEFDMKLGGAVTPGFVFTHLTGIGAGLGVGREKRHSIDFAFTDLTPPPTPKVEVVNFPAISGAPTLSSPVRVKSPRSPEVGAAARQRLDNTLQRLQLQNLRLLR